jgi:hypothetical protein
LAYFLKAKDATFEALQAHGGKLDGTQSTMSSNRWRRRFLSQEFNLYYEVHGIYCQLTAKCIPQQSGAL